MEFQGKVAVITGGASGIGRAVALRMARLGSDVVIADVNRQRMAETEKEMALGRRAMARYCDVSKDEDVEQLATETLKRMGRADILMNNAGVMCRGFADTLGMSDWQWILGINLFGVIRGVKAFLPHMMERGSGYIVNTSSLGGIVGGQPHSIAYSTSKFGVTGYSEVLHKYLRPKGIGVSVLCPGGVRTNLPETARYVGDDRTELGYREGADWGPAALDPDRVAEMVIDAMNSGRFMILTNPELFQAVLLRRAQDMQGYLDDIIRRPQL